MTKERMAPKTKLFMTSLSFAALCPLMSSSAFTIPEAKPLITESACRQTTENIPSPRSLPSSDAINSQTSSCDPLGLPRRSFLANTVTILGTSALAESSCQEANAADKVAGGNLENILGQIKQANEQLDAIPDLIKAEKWDSVRAILIKPPLSDMWTSGGSKKLLNAYAEAIGNELPDGDEIAALELREDAISHLRYLDMAVYNNVFNPIATEGQSGATKELIRSYYEDPMNEWKASKDALNGLVDLASP